MGEEGTTVVQISNISPSSSRDQLYHMFSYFGRIQEFKIYPSDANPISAFSQSKICYIRYERPHSVATAQHMTNTVFVDRALVCVPIPEGEIPSEDTALKLGGPSLPGQRQLPPGVNSTIKTIGKRQVTITHDPKLSAFGLPLYPPLPAQMDESKVEEIRRTIYVSGIPKESDPKDVIHFLGKNIGEVMYLRMAGPEDLPCRYAYVEFSSQHSIPIALQKSGMEYNGAALQFHHSTVAVIKPQTKLLDPEDKDGQDAQLDSKRGSSKERSSHRSRSHRHRCHEHRRSRSKSRRHRSRSSRHSHRSRHRSSGRRKRSRTRSRQRRKSGSRSSRRSESREKSSRVSSKNRKDSAASDRRSQRSKEEKESPRDDRSNEKEKNASKGSPSEVDSMLSTEGDRREPLSEKASDYPELATTNDADEVMFGPPSPNRMFPDSSRDIVEETATVEMEPAEAVGSNGRDESSDFKEPFQLNSPSSLTRVPADKLGKDNGSNEENIGFSRSKRKKSCTPSSSHGRRDRDDDRRSSKKERKKSDRRKEKKSKRSKHKHRRRNESDVSRSSASHQSSD
ncbi:splicing factor, arginine:serine rich [Trichuris trichiura]|uniref:Splicing factor, arginine:serine rich n=1 Tax=Trichuris trichiura TaxID=36087 RepID=A0A077ZB28_TRITR|nr:splicing factor, arginine:serine rich [Trichuris trichiura]